MTQKEMQQLKDQMKQLSQALSKTDLDKVAKQMAELAKLMEQMKLDPETLKKLAQMMRQAGGT
jgi:mevalonate kinase